MMLTDHELNLCVAALRFNAMTYEQLAAQARAKNQIGQAAEYTAYFRACATVAEKMAKGLPKRLIV